MKALILRNQPDAAIANAQALLGQGFQILHVENRDVAETLIRMDRIDLLVMDEELDGCLTHTIALSAERKNPYISSIIVTDRSREETDDLYDLIPSLYALVGHNTSPQIVGQLALSSMHDVDDRREKVRQTLQADITEEFTPEAQAPVAVTQMVDAPLVETRERVAALMAQDVPAALPAPKPEIPTPAIIAVPENVNVLSAQTLADDDVPSYEDIVFATPALADLSDVHYFDDAEEIEEVAKAPSVLPELVSNGVQRPLVLTDAVTNGVRM
ncbi:hypothetical protein [Yoonia sp. BS5-3]|uniref:Response regulatory domain-containing protein n=1 Tax=Yoonia phaeophyticola TaxID=3137369 RepID=A0ABZ2VBF8_9RHOB